MTASTRKFTNKPAMFNAYTKFSILILLTIFLIKLSSNYLSIFKMRLSISQLENLQVQTVTVETKIKTEDFSFKTKSSGSSAGSNSGPSSSLNSSPKNKRISEILPETLPSPKNKILFITEYRSGSTFLSTILDKNKSIFYLFEPLYLLLLSKTDKERISTTQKILLDYYYNCSVPLTENYMEKEDYLKISKKTIETGEKSMFDYCITEGICFRHKTDTFKQPPFCEEEHFEHGVSGDKLRKLCPGFHFSEGKNQGTLKKFSQKICRQKSAISSKVIRIYRLKNLPEKILKDKNFKIIYLVRDPRGLANSRFDAIDSSGKWNEKNTKALSKICNNFHSFIDEREENIIKNKNYKFKLKVVRYEDFALRPLEMAEKLNEFLEIDGNSEEVRNVFEELEKITHNDKSVLDENVLKKIEENNENSNLNKITDDSISEVLGTHLNYTDTEDILDNLNVQYINENDRAVNKPCTFCTVRDTKSNLFHWRKHLRVWGRFLLSENIPSLIQKK